MRMCKLQNGIIMPYELVENIMSNVNLLLNKRVDDTVLSIHALGKKAHDSNYKICKTYKEILKSEKLLDKNGEITSEVQNVILSAINLGNCHETCYKVGNPIKEIFDYDGEVEMLGENYT